MWRRERGGNRCSIDGDLSSEVVVVTTVTGTKAKSGLLAFRFGQAAQRAGTRTGDLNAQTGFSGRRCRTAFRRRGCHLEGSGACIGMQIKGRMRGHSTASSIGPAEQLVYAEIGPKNRRIKRAACAIVSHSDRRDHEQKFN